MTTLIFCSSLGAVFFFCVVFLPITLISWLLPDAPKVSRYETSSVTAAVSLSSFGSAAATIPKVVQLLTDL